ncbi:MAG: Ig-like domain-containing protein, partial [Pseudolysinimonas sp.]
PPPKPKDTKAPVVTSIKASKTVVLNNEVSTISFASTDNVKVKKVVLKWSNGSVSGSVTLGASGNYDWSSNSAAANSYGKYTFTAKAYDAAGNASAGVQVIVDRQYFG